MKWNYSLLLAGISAGLLLLSGCYTKQQAMRKFCLPNQEISKDSTWKDSSQLVNSSALIQESSTISPAVTLTAKFNPCDSLNGVNPNLNIKLASGTGKLNVNAVGDMVEVECNCDSAVNSMRLEIHSRDSTIKVLSGSKSFTQGTAPKWTQKPLTAKEFMLLLSFCLLIIALIIYLIKKNRYADSRNRR